MFARLDHDQCASRPHVADYSHEPAIDAPEFDPVLIAHYDTAGLRYASYPSAPQFAATSTRRRCVR